VEYFLKNNLPAIFAIILYGVFSKKEIDDKEKVVVSYSFIVLLSILKILDIKIMLIILILISFLYFEVLINDYYKQKIIKKLRYKIVDFIYLLLFKYSFHFYLLSLTIISTTFENYIKLPRYQVLVYFSLIFLYVILYISNNDFELKSFTEIFTTLEKNIDFASFDKLEDRCKKILLYIEDKSYFERPHNYTIFCWDYIKYQINRINAILFKVENGLGKKHTLVSIFTFLKYSIKQFILQLTDIPRFIRRIYNGHSTIEMQLFRSISVNDGYKKKHQRKIAELIYTPIFFSGLKDYFKMNYKTVSDKYFKDYIIACYLKSALVFYNDKTYNNIYSLKENLKSKTFTKCDFLFYVLCLSGKLKKERLSEFGREYERYLYVFDIPIKELNLSIKKYQKLK